MPLVSFLESKLRHRIIAIIVAYLVAVVPLFGILFFFFNQSRILFNELPSLRDKLNNVSIWFMDWFNQQFNINPQTSSDWIDNIMATIDIPIELLQGSFQSGTSILANTVLIVLITYFLLLYRTAFKNFLLSQLGPKYRETTQQLFEQLKKLAKRYMIGQGLVILILGLLIGFGLWLIGVPYPFFWGFLAGFLEIIPYVGTSIGAILPITYMLMVSDSLWQPVAVLIWYIIIQQLEGNVISPNVMGSSIKVNPLFIIMGLFLGGFMWGVSGMILALPVLAITKEVFRSYDVLEPISYLMEDGLSRKADIFLGKFDKEEYRFLKLFFKDKE